MIFRILMFGVLDSLIMTGGKFFRRINGIIDTTRAPDCYFNRAVYGKKEGLNFALLPASSFTIPFTRRAFVDDKTAIAFVLPRLPVLPEPKVMGNFLKEHSKRLLDEIYLKKYENLEIRCHSLPGMMGLWLASQDSKRERRIKKLTLVSCASDFSVDSWNSPSTSDIFKEARRRGYTLEDYKRELKEFDFESYGLGLKDCEIELHHGNWDGMVPFEMGVRLRDRLKSVGNKPNVFVYPGHDHTSTLVAYALRNRK